MNNEKIENVVSVLSKTSAQIDVEKVAEYTFNATNVDKDLEAIEMLNPHDAYDKINETIENSDLAPDKKIALYNANQEKLLENNDKAADTLDKLRTNKISNLFLILFLLFGGAGAYFGGYQLGHIQKKDDDIYDSDDYSVS